MIADGRDGKLLIHCFGGCEWRDVYAALRERGLVRGGSGEIDREREAEFRGRRKAAAKAEAERLARVIGRARALYRRAMSAEGTPVETYLRSRGITLPIPPELRWLRHCPHRNGGYYPAMVAPIVNLSGEQVAIHKTFLRPDGSGKTDLPKAEQRETCGPMKGGAVRLARHRPGIPLLVGEGVESTLSAMELFEMAGWAALGTSGIAALELPDDVREVFVAADRDANQAGQRHALIARERWESEERSVRILMPPALGQDFNDVLLAGRRQ